MVADGKQGNEVFFEDLKQVFRLLDSAASGFFAHLFHDVQGGVHAEIGFDQDSLEIIKK